MNRLTRPVPKAPRLLQPRTWLRHMRKMKKSSPSAARRSMRRGMSRQLAPAQTTRRGNVNGYLYHHPPRSQSGKNSSRPPLAGSIPTAPTFRVRPGVAICNSRRTAICRRSSSCRSIVSPNLPRRRRARLVCRSRPNPDVQDTIVRKTDAFRQARESVQERASELRGSSAYVAQTSAFSSDSGQTA